jgi:hypothetical protein
VVASAVRCWVYGPPFFFRRLAGPSAPGTAPDHYLKEPARRWGDWCPDDILPLLPNYVSFKNLATVISCPVITADQTFPDRVRLSPRTRRRQHGVQSGNFLCPPWRVFALGPRAEYPRISIYQDAPLAQVLLVRAEPRAASVSHRWRMAA